MPQQPESAARTRICKVDEGMISRKIRVAGRITSYNADTGLAVLLDGKFGLLVDTELALDESSGEWATERLCTVMVIGHVERTEQSFAAAAAPPRLPAHASTVQIDMKLVLRAILIVRSPDLDLKLWNSVLEEAEKCRGESEDVQ
ncbi:hypothetical protein JR316_0001926 [Psilocybe cubensis]|uniref:Uncharacterized protein n=2 Tax=Psilocybe cubensis TaxID=181762 RepID=A0ACB8HBI7_PSICU|nr:hypothetical protein JR316_0001926 [Psilocybe cubensis]KAH9485022.1 hypothetical protein JR316_0001926 [Psilocybe cubensis]